MKSLYTQIVIVCVSLVAVTAISIQAASWWLASEHNKSLLQEQIAGANKSLLHYLQVRQSSLVSSSIVLAADFGFKQAIATRHEPTINTMLMNHGRRIDVELMLLTDKSGQALANNGIQLKPQDYRRLHDTLAVNPLTPTFMALDNHVYRLFAIPVEAPVTIAYLYVGFEVNKALLNQLKDSIGLNLSFVSTKGDYLVSTLDQHAFELDASLLTIDDTDWGFGFGRRWETREIMLDKTAAPSVRLLAHADLAAYNDDFKRLTYIIIGLSSVILLLAFISGSRLARRISNPHSALHRELLFRAHHDALTGMLNRGAALDKIAQEVKRAQREKSIYCLFVCDVDHFKQINDQYGHLAGDAVLEEVATRLANALRDYDVIGRYGGEEFVVGVKVSESKSRDIGQRLRKAVNGSPIVGKNFSVDITVSIGGQLIYPDDEFDTLNEVIEYADQALYRAKKNGRDQVELSSSAMPTKRRING